MNCGCYYEPKKKGFKWVLCDEAERLWKVYKRTQKKEDRINYDKHFQ